jgi:ABC-type multidrug transport system fused ATPase/permease subunit
MDKAIVNSVCMLGAFLMFLVAHYAGTELTVARMFSCLQVIFAFKYAMDMLSTALEGYYEALVVMERFSSILNIEARGMINIETENKALKQKMGQRKDK